MEFLRRIIEQIKTQLGGLKTSERLVIILLMIIMFGAVYWRMQYAAEREMTPLLNQEFSQKAQRRIIGKLDLWDAPYEIKGSQILVPKSQHRKLLTKLAYEELLPDDTSVGYELLLEDTNIWTPSYVHEDKKKIILQKMLGRTIADFPGVTKVEVFINQSDKRTLSNFRPAPSASVSVWTERGAGSLKKLASSVAALVSSANNRMRRENVTVLINGKQIPVGSEGEEMAGDYLELVALWESKFRKKIISVLGPINALVEVNLELQNTSKKTKSRQVSNADEGSLVAIIEESSRSSASSDTERSKEPGLVANSTDFSSTGGGKSRQEETEDGMKKKTVIPGIIEEEMITPQGGVIRESITAVVSIPEAYFKNVAKARLADGQEPSADLISRIKEEEIPKFEEKVMAVIGLAGKKEVKDHVVVDSYWAEGVIAGQEELGGASGGSAEVAGGFTVAGMLGSYGKHIAVSALAVISLLMALMMVRKAAGPVEITEDEATGMMTGSKPVDALSVEESNLEDDDNASLLQGMELEEDAVRSQQILEQIRNMVNEEPDAAATLVAKWASQNE